MNKFAIYTAIVGDYDEIPQPLIVDDRFDYILFSNDIKKTKVGAWQIRNIVYENADRIKIARWVKTHPTELLPEYVFSVWIDANIQIKTDYIYYKVMDLFDTSIHISTVVHPQRDCIYNEMFTVYDSYLETESTLFDWAKILRRNRYPKKNGLNETNILYRNHSTDIIKRFNNLWWSYIEKYSRRDQLSFNFALWQLNISCEPILPVGESAFKSEHFNYIGHTNAKRKYFDRTKDFSLLRRYYLDLPNKKKEIENVYYKIFGMRFPKFWAWVFGQYYRLKFHIQRKIR
ncbi:MAG: DUF616 domain-containing protein [Salinivirgaceae bacterium]|nr:DUF616 domain-containing protein [Salinivirgaceae bacterium]